MKKISISLLIIMLIMIMPIQLFAIETSTTLKSTDTHGIIIKAKSGTTASITVTVTGSYPYANRIVKEEGVFVVALKPTFTSTITLGSNEIFAIQDLTSGSVTIKYNDSYVDLIVDDIADYVQLYNQELTLEEDYQTWETYPQSILLTSTYPYQAIIQRSDGLIRLVYSTTKIASISGSLYATSGTLRFSTWDSIGFQWQTSSSTSSQIFATILQANNDIYTSYSNDIVAFTKTTASSVIVGGGIGTSESLAIVNMISPSEGFSDNINLFAFMAQYKLLQVDYPDKAKITIDITGGISGTGSVLSHDFRSINGNWDGLIRFDRLMNEGSNAISVIVKYNGIEVGRETVNVTYFPDFIDENDDGKDDRTGQEEGTNYYPPSNPNPSRDAYEDTIFGDIAYALDVILYYVKQPFIFIAEGLMGIVEFLGNVVSQVGNVIILVGQLFSFLPSQVVAMIGAVFTIGGIIAVMNWMRK